MHSLRHDRFALAAAIYLLLLLLLCLFGPLLMGDLASKMNLSSRNLPPFSLERGWLYFLGGDNLGRSMIARLVVGAQNTILIAVSAVAAGVAFGGAIGLAAGYFGGWTEAIIMRLTEIIMSFPALLMALLVLFLLGPNITNVIIILAITRAPLYISTTRAEVLEIRQRTFVRASELMGAGAPHIVTHHILPVVAPTLITIASIDFATVVLIESALSFLGLGIQPPDFTWGAMVSAGRSYLAVAWWLALWPGLMILLTTISFNLVGNWVRAMNDPKQRALMDGSGPLNG